MVTLEELKKLLKSYTAICREIERLQNEIKKIQETYADINAVNLDGMPKSNRATSHIENVVVNMLTLKDKYAEMLDNAISNKIEIENIIESIKDATGKIILQYRFLDNYTFERIAELTHYSTRQVINIYNNTLKSLTIEKSIFKGK